jgi:c-di-GMP-binding flagellar brake protein YcgR
VTDREPAIPPQRRAAVRARVRVPVTVTTGGERLQGNTLDLSEGGAACAVSAGRTTEALPTAGAGVDVVLELENARVRLAAEVLSAVPRRGWWIVTVRFPDASEGDAHLVRTHVFTVLRRERAAGFS